MVLIGLLSIYVGCWIVFGMPSILINKISQAAQNNKHKTAEITLGAIAGFLVAYIFGIPYYLDVTFCGALVTFIIGEILSCFCS